MKKHPDSPTVETAPSASLEADINPAPQPDNQLVPEPQSSLPTLPEAAEDGAPPEVYDPADYRWVPVRRRPRTDGWTEEKQRRFIEMLADTGFVSAAARFVGESRETA